MSNTNTNCSYDVFLSFRGEDTRHTFTGHLYDALCRKGIMTFMDDEKLRVGEQIAPALVRAIEQSKISIIIFSQNYADSTWCLNELLMILDCMKEKNQLVWPIFYKVEPSDVRHQKRSYREAMTKHEIRFGKDSEKVQKWRSALFQVSNFKGYHLKDGYEFKFIQDIVNKAYDKVSPKDIDMNEHIVGLEYRVEELKTLLEIESRNTSYFLGIYGTGGIGKTTLAKYLYNSIYNKFEGACFLYNVRETSNQFNGQILLQQNLLSQILGEGKVLLESVDEGIKSIKRKLGQQRVLIILDDVDDIEQTKILAGGRDWFGSGSRIIITTRNKSLLNFHKVEVRYEMKVLNDHESLKLFCRNAFRKSYPESGYEDLSNRAVCYAKGLPLALKVIGSYLFDKNVDECRSALDNYEKNPHKDIQSILRISYDSLEHNQQNIFLDVACFFKGRRVEYVKRILDACEFHAEDGIRTLVDKSLVYVEYGYLRMHDLIQDMGKEIVKQEAPEKPGERSRLWFYDDVLQVLSQNTGSSNIKGIILDPPTRKIVRWIDLTAFKKMENLRILIIRNIIFLYTSRPSYLSNELRLLEWSDYPSLALPKGFNPEKIVSINIRKSPLVLKRPFQRFEHLTYLTISSCEVTKFPDVSGAKYLRELRVDRCTKLVAVHESLGHLPNLVYLRASECIQLTRFLPKLCLPSLEYLSFNFCKRLAHFPDVDERMVKLLKINVVGTAIEELPQAISKLTGLNYLEMTCCMGLQDVPSSLFKLPNFATLKVGACSQLPKSVRRLEGSQCWPCLRTLHFGYAGLLDEDIHVIIHSFPNLEDLNVSGNNFVSLPTHIKELIYLTNLDVSRCKKLQEIPELPLSIRKIDARLCWSLSFNTSRMLWSQVRKEINRLEIYMPSIPSQSREEIEKYFEEMLKGDEEIKENEECIKVIQDHLLVGLVRVLRIPLWFDHIGRREILVFRARRKFPVVALAFVFGEEKTDCYYSKCEWHGVDLHLFIDGERVHSRRYCKFIVVENHVLLIDLRVLFSEEEWEGLDARVGQDWKTVQIDYETNLKLSVWGVHVYKQETNMEDIEFEIPDPSSSGIRQPRPLVPISEEDELRNRIASSDLPAIFRDLLKEKDEYEDALVSCFKFMIEKEDEMTMLTAGMWRMSRKIMALREGKVTPGSRLEDDEDYEDDLLFQLIFSGDNIFDQPLTCSDSLAGLLTIWRQKLCCQYLFD